MENLAPESMLINVDSTMHDPEIVTTARAARLLGVKRETLYAYASRGLIGRVPLGKGRASGYVLADVERLKARSAARSGHGPVASGALRWGEPVLDSAITRIDPERGPIYRGHAAIDLARAGATFEEVAHILWQCEPRGSSAPPWTPLPKGRSKASTLLGSFALSVVSLGLGDPARAGGAPEAELERARRLIACLAGVRATGPRIATAFLDSIGAKRSAEARAALDRALVLSADHELNASTFAVRVTASAEADLYACITSGIATLSGPLHGGESDRVEALLAEIGSARRVRDVILARAQRGERIPGFGHTLYPDGDPRMAPLFTAACALAPKATRTIATLVDEARRTLKLEPNIDTALVALAHAIGAPGTGSSIFALGRCAGWVAHVLEQREAGYLLRPRARYVGVAAVRGG